jgi:hypothetical protein
LSCLKFLITRSNRVEQIVIMKEITKGCVYWYEVSMHADIKGNGVHVSTPIRIPVVCMVTNEHTSVCQYLNPSSGKVEIREIQNSNLYESPIVKKL